MTFFVNATAFKQKISKVYLHSIRTEASYHSQWPLVNVKANFCARLILCDRQNRSTGDGAARSQE